MITTSEPAKRYNAAQQRYLKPILERFMKREFPSNFGPIMRERLAEELTNIFYSMHPQRKHVKPGQVAWNALDQNTRGDDPDRKYVPVTLTIISAEDIEQLGKGIPMSEIQKKVIARMTREAYQQGGIMSMRDIGLLTLTQPSTTSHRRIAYEKENDTQLPHTGNLHDMGSCLTHKEQIIYKVIAERKDPASVAKETNHSIKAVDRYLNDYYRIKTAYQKFKDIEQIHIITNIAKPVINQYIQIMNEYDKKD